MPVLIPALALLVVAQVSASAQSYYTVRPDDPSAVSLTRDRFGVVGDGAADDTTGIQRAIDAVQESTGEGIVLVPEGRYRIARTVHVWPGIRLIGFGARRPVFVLGQRAAGFQDPAAPGYMLFFAGARPEEPGTAPPDANPGTFYSALSNIDLEILEGNPGAVGVRSKYAQHCFTSHVEFRIGSGLAGIHEAGNVAEDVRFIGGEYGIWTSTPSPSWQFTVVDAVFEGQRQAAIRDRTAGLTLVRPHFRNVPTAITMEEGSPENLWVKDARIEDVSGPAFIISQEQSPRTQVNMEGVACRGVPVFARFRESGRTVAGPGAIYLVKAFVHGLGYVDVSSPGRMMDVFEAEPLVALPPPVPSDLAPLPPGSTWANVRALGAKGDGVTDDTAVFRKAVIEHQAVYVPTGKYLVSDTITLGPGTALIGLHPNTTQLVIPDRTPAFQGPGSPKALLETPRGGTNIVIGIGLYTNAINRRAVAAKWMAGERSLMNDVRFLGGHGTAGLDGTRQSPYNASRTGDPDPNRRWDSQYPSLWVTDGGGGTFFDLWTPSSFAQSGMLVSDTSTPGRVYHMSAEHHVRYEVQLRNVRNWVFYALQTEAERGESGFASALEIDGSSNITVANTHIYRVISSLEPFPFAVRVADSENIRFRNMHSYSNSKVAYDATIWDQSRGGELRQREFATLTVGGSASAAPAPVRSRVLAPGARVERLAGGFHNISGGTVDAAGDFYFVDARWQRIFRWSSSQQALRVVSDAPLEPVNLAFDRAGHMLIVSYTGNGTVYAVKPGASETTLVTLHPTPASARSDATPVLPVGDWSLHPQDGSGLLPPRTHHYVSPDGSTFIAAPQEFVDGTTSWGVKASDLLRTFGLAPVGPGRRAYFTSEATATTWSADVGADGNLADARVFVHQGGEGVTTSPDGNVYIAAGQVHVYTPAGELIETIAVPERPLQVVFGGPDGRTLFMPARHGLYAVRVGGDH